MTIMSAIYFIVGNCKYDASFYIELFYLVNCVFSKHAMNNSIWSRIGDHRVRYASFVPTFTVSTYEKRSYFTLCVFYRMCNVNAHNVFAFVR